MDRQSWGGKDPKAGAMNFQLNCQVNRVSSRVCTGTEGSAYIGIQGLGLLDAREVKSRIWLFKKIKIIVVIF